MALGLGPRVWILGRLKLEWPCIYSPQSWTLPYKSSNYTSLQINSNCADSCASQYKHLLKHSLQSVFNINLILFCTDGLDQWIYKDDICHISILILKVQNTNLTTTHCLEIDNILAFIFNLESLDIYVMYVLWDMKQFFRSTCYYDIFSYFAGSVQPPGHHWLPPWLWSCPQRSYEGAGVVD